MSQKFITMTEEHAKRWLKKLKNLTLTSTQEYFQLDIESTDNLLKFIDDFEEAVNLSEEVQPEQSYLVCHPDGDKFAVSSVDAKTARDIVIERVFRDYEEVWSTADL